MDRLNNEDKATVSLIGVGAVLAIAGMLLTQIGCGGVLLAATPEGMREFANRDVGMIEQGKAGPDKESAYWQTRKIEARQPTFWQRIAGGANGNTTEVR